MHYAIIACQVFFRELSAATAAGKNTYTVHWLPQGLHDTPDLLREKLQGLIDQIEMEQETLPPRRRYDAILLCYGLCGLGTCRLRAKRLPLAIPRTDDCIGVLLGSQARYLELFESRQGIYWYSPGWLEFADYPCPEYYDEKRADYSARFDEDCVEYLMEEARGWISKYQNAIYIHPSKNPAARFSALAKANALWNGWNYEEAQGSSYLLDSLLAGGWDESLFLVCPPGRMIQESGGPDKFSIGD